MLQCYEHFNVAVSADEIEQQSKGVIPKNMAKSTEWVQMEIVLSFYLFELLL